MTWVTIISQRDRASRQDVARAEGKSEEATPAFPGESIRGQGLCGGGKRVTNKSWTSDTNRGDPKG